MKNSPSKERSFKLLVGIHKFYYFRTSLDKLTEFGSEMTGVDSALSINVIN